MSELETAAHRFMIVELLAEVAAARPDGREWLAGVASRALRAASETQRDCPMIAEEAAALRSVLSEITEAAALAQHRRGRSDGHG